MDGTLLAERGAVDPEVARQMAAGVRRVLGADWGIATTGVAGPDPQDGQPVGTVYVAVAGPAGVEKVVRAAVERSTGRTSVERVYGACSSCSPANSARMRGHRIRNRTGGIDVCSPE